MYVYKALYKPTIKQQKQCITRCSTDESESCACKERDRDLNRIYLHPSPATEDAMTSIHNISDFSAAAAIRARHQRILSELEANHTNTHEPGAKNTDLDPTEALV